MIYLVECKNDFGSTVEHWWQPFHSEENLTRWLTWHKGHTIVLGVYRAERINLRPITEPAQKIVGYEVVHD